ncbi:MAG: hypothetical protein C0432_05895 [Candidatus Puniceispirillum sp.]|nr:hypothetical protein [Candidatus Pelagibacter sp.]MBA4283807.1 hypothetical protein [Candidatus Puniceispirillum sp.]
MILFNNFFQRISISWPLQKSLLQASRAELLLLLLSSVTFSCVPFCLKVLIKKDFEATASRLPRRRKSTFYP